MKSLSREKLDRYFSVTSAAYNKAKGSGNKTGMTRQRDDFLDMIGRYLSDARHFFSKGDYVNAFACLNYAHGWLDAGARLGIFDVNDSSLFTVDE
ncbi:DUF357 domain-containing protein [Candidatus Woesearchaeota archaeon]|nr:DUF357 domain-containing protein [Candidatus Woesearchaeota archaeon]